VANFQADRKIGGEKHGQVLVLLAGYLYKYSYPKTGIKEIYGKTSVRVCAPIQMILLHFWVQ